MLMLEAEDGSRSSRLGHVIGNYRLLRVLGEGGVGTVYEAEHVRLGRRVALKLLHPEVVDTEVVTRFFNEARAVNEIRHANIIEVEDFVTTPTGEHYMLMELLKGEDLRTVMAREKTLDPERVARIGEQIASALAAVHAVDIIHRDLKPDNVFVIQRDGEEMSKLLDFGVAKFTNDSTGLTRAGMTMGTPQYMAPEQIIAGMEVGTGSDIYALGILMYELLTGVTPFNGTSIAAVLRAHVSEAVVPPSVRRGEPLPPVLEAAVMKCLEKEIEDRFATADELAEALRADEPVKLSGRVTTRAATQSGRAQTQPGQSARMAAQSGQSARTPSQSARMASQSGRMASQSGRAGTEPPVETLQPSPVRRSRRFVQMLPALAMAAAAAVIHFWPHREPGTASAAPAPIAAPRAETSNPQRPEPEIKAAAPSELQLSLVTKPTGAQLFLGTERKPLGVAPVTIALPISSDPVTLIAKFADGREVSETIVPDGPRRDLVIVRPIEKAIGKPVEKPRPADTVHKPRPPETKPPAGTKPDRDATLDPFK
jgi:serine/threonine protein kinase